MPRITNDDGLVEHQGRPRRKSLATLLEEAVASDDVRAAVASWLGLPAVACVGEVVKTAIDADRLLDTLDYARSIAGPASTTITIGGQSFITYGPFLVTCAAFALWASGQVPHVPTASEARSFRHLSNIAAAADRDEPSPIRTTLTADERRVRRQAAALGILKGASK